MMRVPGLRVYEVEVELGSFLSLAGFGHWGRAFPKMNCLKF